MTDQPSITTTKPRLVTTREQLRRELAEARSTHKTIGLVPTMGTLHAGHFSLVETAESECDFTVTTIFVNSTQFGQTEDFAGYPRELEDDLRALSRYRTDLVYAPSEAEVYRDGHSTYVEPPTAAQTLEGRCRPGHFRGVTTVVLKLLNLVGPNIAYFGQKDYQQTVVIRRMVDDLDLPVAIRVCPIVREEDGLAMGSRNQYLNSSERIQAPALSKSLKLAAELVEQGECNPAVILAQMRQVLAHAGISRVDYLAIVDPETLADVRRIDGPVMALVAAQLGKTRLIDNSRIG
jgi:pantoate--beta-alanine ligase